MYDLGKCGAKHPDFVSEPQEAGTKEARLACPEPHMLTHPKSQDLAK